MKPHIPLLTLLALSSAGAMAQGLHTEITVDRTVLPEVSKVQRPTGLAPSLYAPQMAAASLEAAEYTLSAWPQAEVGQLPAPAHADSIARTPWRGYASVGYLPLYNMLANAGYRLVDTRKWGLGVWANYNGYSYNGNMPYFDGALFTNHYLTGGGDISVRLGAKTVIRAEGKASYSSVRTPFFYNLKGAELRRSYTQTVRQLDGRMSLDTRRDNVVFSLSGAMQYFGVDMAKPRRLRLHEGRMRQALATGTMTVGVADDDHSLPWIGVDMDLTGMRSTNIKQGLIGGYIDRYVTMNLYEAHAKPYLRFDNDHIEGLIGANVSVGRNYDAHVRVAPVASITWRPVSFLAMYANAEGGEYLNPMSRIYAINPYIDPSMAYGRTNIPLVARGGLNLGPYDGMSLAIRGGYAMARGYLSPLITIERTGTLRSTLYGADVDSWYVGASLGFAYQDLFRLDFDIATGGADRPTHSWYEWIDAAKVVSAVKLTITSVDPLKVSLGYDMRYERKARSLIYPYNSPSMLVNAGRPNLGTINDVNLSGTYRINQQVSAFAEVQNILCHRYVLISGMPGPSIHGVLGISCKF